MKWRLAVSVLLLALAALPALAQTDEPTRAENEKYFFAFTVEANCFVTYPEGGDGFSAIHNPQGGGKGTQADYGLLVFGSPYYKFTDAEKAAIKLDLGTDGMLSVSEVKTNARFSEIFEAAMATHGWNPIGDATIKVEDGPSQKVPYFSWSQAAKGKTHYALMYVVMHGDAFITVQVEGSRPFTKAQTEWFITKLELEKIAAPES